jgi:general secretion pathway protein G
MSTPNRNDKDSMVCPTASGKKKGFTLIEMLIVMAIVALLLTLALPRYWGALDKAKDVALQDNLKVLRSAIDQFNADKGHYPESLQELVEKKYLRSVPPDPITESIQTWIMIPSSDANNPGMSDIKSGAPGSTPQGTNYGAL